MKKIITTVGTSLFTNYNSEEIRYLFGDEYKSISDNLEKLKNIPAREFNNPKYKIFIDDIEKIIKEKWLLGFKKKDGDWEGPDYQGKNYHASAEITSIQKILEKNNDEMFEIILVSSDTILSKLASDLLSKILKEIFKNIANINPVTANKLTISNNNDFSEGLINLVEIIREEVESTLKGNGTNSNLLFDNKNLESISNNLFMNISGGYKVVIPYLTIISMITKMSIYYIFEDSNELIEIPSIPIGFDEIFLENIYFDLQSRDFSDQLKIKELQQYGLIEKKNSNYQLSAMGEFLKGYLEGQSTQAKNVFGFIMEYKLQEYFFNNPIKIGGKALKKIERSIYVAKKEIDLVMKNNDGGDEYYCFAEVKSIYPFIYKSSKMLDDFEKRIKKIEATYTPKKYEYHYYIYHINPKLNNDIIQRRNMLINEIKRIKCNGIVKFFDVTVPKETNSDFEYQNPYQSYVTSKISKTDINLIGD